MPATIPIDLFFSYVPEDEGLRRELEKHLSVLTRQGTLLGWNDRLVTAGAEWRGVVDARLEAAEIVLLLVSASYLASDYCYDVEVARAVARHEAGRATVIPVILRPCDWKDAPFGKLRALPADGRPVTSWPDVDAALASVAAELRRVAEARRRPNPPRAHPLPAPSG